MSGDADVGVDAGEEREVSGGSPECSDAWEKATEPCCTDAACSASREP